MSHLLIEKELRDENKVECWMIKNEKVEAKIAGLKTKVVFIFAFKEKFLSHFLCKEEYKKINKKFPPWNFQKIMKNKKYEIND